MATGEQQSSLQRPSNPLFHHRPLSIPNRRSGSPNIPLHLLNPFPTTPAQLRHYSSESQRRHDDPPTQESEDTNSTDKPQPTSSFASAFGFQSLKGLFYQEPPRNRYSRPRESEHEIFDLSPTPQSSATDSGDDGRVDSVQSRSSPTASSSAHINDFGSSTAPDQSISDSYSSVASARNDTLEHGAQPWPSSTVSSVADKASLDSPLPSDESTQNTHRFTMRRTEKVQSEGTVSVNISKQYNTPKTGTAKLHALRSGQSTHNPSVTQSHLSRNSLSAESIPDRSLDEETTRPWGLAPEASGATGSLTLPGVTLQDKRKPYSPSQDGAFPRRPTVKDPPSKTTPTTPLSPQTLTHVNTSGEARMVDVGAKQATKRTAVARASIAFSNAEPFRLVVENTNKKGDVLGVARVAGIMGAKRTSDLIPLCHPIPITKIELDVHLVAPNSEHVALNAKAGIYGAVGIQALVESVGTTGVEMEALTAASIAVLTVYDMCKAVDKQATMYGASVVYKSGGKSGLHTQQAWANRRGNEWFAERGLDLPDFGPKAPQGKDTTKAPGVGRSKRT